MFGFMSMAGNYEDRKVDRYEIKDLIISTCSVNDSDHPYETAISHKSYNDGHWVIVEHYDDLESSKLGHSKWVKKMISKKLPKELKDVSTSDVAKFCNLFINVNETYKKDKKLKALESLR